ncbi:hypothetical protein SprV_0802581100 [Sparganum proliferum]
MTISRAITLFLLAVICSGTLCHGGENNVQETSVDAKNAKVDTSQIRTFPLLDDTALKAEGHSYTAVIKMKALEGSTATFKAILRRSEGSRKSCAMRLKRNVLSCVVTRLQPNSTYNVAVEVCTQENLCTVHDSNLKVRTMPGVPRYMSVGYRTTNSFRVSWLKSLEDPNNQYVYKVKAVSGLKSYTCDSLSSDQSSSCLITNLTRGTKYSVYVSACTSDGYCSDKITPLLGETYPNAPRNSRVVKAYQTILGMKFDGPPDDPRGTEFWYVGRFEPANDLNIYRDGCQSRDLENIRKCEIDYIAPGRMYKFRTFACTDKTFLCNEGEPLFAKTAAQGIMSLVAARLDNGSVYLSWISNITADDKPGHHFQLRIEQLPDKVHRVPVAEGQFDHIFDGLSTDPLYRFILSLCNGKECKDISHYFMNPYNRGVKPHPPKNITQTTAHFSWSERSGLVGALNYNFVYATPVDARWSKQECVAVGRQECMLTNLRPDTEYNVVIQGCDTLAICYAPAKPITIRTAKPDTLEAPSDVHVSNNEVTSFSLNWTKPLIDAGDSFDYKVTLTAPHNPEIAETSFLCETTLVDGKVSCLVENAYTDIPYTVKLTACVTADLCSAPSKPIAAKIAIKDGYVLKPTEIEPRYVTVSWFSDQTKPDTEFRVVVNSSSTTACASKVSAGEHACRVKGLLPSEKYSFKLRECQTGTNVCGDLFNLLVQTTSDERIHQVLNDLVSDIDQANTAPADPTRQLMIRVAYSKLGVATIGTLEGVSAVITPIGQGSPSKGPNWSAPSRYLTESAKALQMVGGTYLNPIDGSWEVRLPLPDAKADSKLPDENVVLGTAEGVVFDSHDYNGQLAAGTTYAIQLRVYTDLGFGTTAPKIMRTADFQTGSEANGGLIAVSVILAILCVVLIASVIVLVLTRRNKKVNPSEPNKSELAANPGEYI